MAKQTANAILELQSEDAHMIEMVGADAREQALITIAELKFAMPFIFRSVLIERRQLFRDCCR